ncbi:hypothetical protein GDO81_017682 [Engystomops pustulosus]|uniref:Uncharacterized protein n=1 Tax=Engystomops pustulosus TaxID=76066 RepID=A0AAV7A2A6_ENGPU|nr:hypothetical protein GDO81_017682 [Engystomops pustulosus]
MKVNQTREPHGLGLEGVHPIFTFICIFTTVSWIIQMDWGASSLYFVYRSSCRFLPVIL